MQVVKAGTKIEAIAGALATFCNLKLIEEGGEYFIVKMERQTCRHRDTDHCAHCNDPANVPCSKWEYDKTLLETNSITDHLVRCSHVGNHTACISCNHGANHAALNDCTEHDDTCPHVAGTFVKCMPIKGGN